jgi:tryptophanyl-tRNA synthetase
MKTLLTAFKPSVLHLGNVHAIREALGQLHQHNSFVMVADYHAIPVAIDPDLLRRRTIELVKTYLALGMDPNRVIIFKQSDVPEHTELAWVLSCVTPVSLLDPPQDFGTKTAGRLMYPVLMAADILLYNPEVFLVGPDQRRNIERTQQIAKLFEERFGGTFSSPRGEVLGNIVLSADSKPYGHNIPLSASKEQVANSVRATLSAAADKKVEALHLHGTVKGEGELKPLYETDEAMGGELEQILIQDIEDAIAPVRGQLASLSDDVVLRVLAEGAEKARQHASPRMIEIKRKIGVLN